MGNQIKRYNQAEMVSLMHTEKVGADDFTYLSALHNYGIVGVDEATGATSLAGIKCVDVKVIQVDQYETGYFYEQGKELFIVINEGNTILDYDFISEIHPIKDADVYLWISRPWADVGSDIGIHGEWYRRDTYKDGMEPFNGTTLGWEDLPPQKIGVGDD